MPLLLLGGINLFAGFGSSIEKHHDRPKLREHFLKRDLAVKQLKYGFRLAQIKSTMPNLSTEDAQLLENFRAHLSSKLNRATQWHEQLLRRVNNEEIKTKEQYRLAKLNFEQGQNTDDFDLRKLQPLFKPIQSLETNVVDNSSNDRELLPLMTTYNNTISSLINEMVDDKAQKILEDEIALFARAVSEKIAQRDAQREECKMGRHYQSFLMQHDQAEDEETRRWAADMMLAAGTPFIAGREIAHDDMEMMVLEAQCKASCLQIIAAREALKKQIHDELNVSSLNEINFPPLSEFIKNQAKKQQLKVFQNW